MNLLRTLFSVSEDYKQETQRFQKIDLLFSLAAYLFTCFIFYAMGRYFYVLGNRLSKPIFYTVELLQVLICLLIIFVFCKIRKQAFLQSASLGQLKRAFASGMFIAAVCFIVIGFMGNWTFNYDLKTACIRLLYYLVYISFFEEFLFRGYIGKRFYGVISNKLLAVFLVAVLFSLIHIPFQMAYHGTDFITYISNSWGNLLFCFVMHFLFQLMYARFNSIVMPCIVHCFWDFLQDLFL